jgi:hypothetical protein
VPDRPRSRNERPLRRGDPAAGAERGPAVRGVPNQQAQRLKSCHSTLLDLARSGSGDHHDRIAAEAAALVLASPRAFGKHAARIRLPLAGEAELSTHRLLEVVGFVHLDHFAARRSGSLSRWRCEASRRRAPALMPSFRWGSLAPRRSSRETVPFGPGEPACSPRTVAPLALSFVLEYSSRLAKLA